MNYSLKLFDNAKVNNEKYSNFLVLSRITLVVLERYPAALSIYLILRFWADSSSTVNVKKIANRAGMPCATVNKALNYLEKSGLIRRNLEGECFPRRIVNATDRRSRPDRTCRIIVYTVPNNIFSKLFYISENSKGISNEKVDATASVSINVSANPTRMEPIKVEQECNDTNWMANIDIGL